MMKQRNIQLLPATYSAPDHFNPAAYAVPRPSSRISNICHKRKLDDRVAIDRALSSITGSGLEGRPVKLVKSSNAPMISSVGLGSKRPLVQRVNSFQDLMSSTANPTMGVGSVRPIMKKVNNSNKLSSTPTVGVGAMRQVLQQVNTSDKLSSTGALGLICPVLQRVNASDKLSSTPNVRIGSIRKILQQVDTSDNLSSTGAVGLVRPAVQKVNTVDIYSHCSSGITNKYSPVIFESIAENVVSDEKVEMFEVTTAGTSNKTPPIELDKEPAVNESSPVILESIADNVVTDEKDEMLKATSSATSNETPLNEIDKEPVVVNKGVSLTEYFTAEQLKVHISSLKPSVDDQVLDRDEPCQLCGINLLRFTPPPIYCSTCEARIKHGVTFYSDPNVSVPHYFCKKCFGAFKKGVIRFNGIDFFKNGLISSKSEDATEEFWVECNKCKKWQHQICTLYNAKKDLNGDATYTCPVCCLNEGGRVLSSTTKAKGAKDLPTTKLSDFVETRLLRRLKEDKHDVPNIVVREVLSVDRKLKVQNNFYKLVRDGSHPAQLPYRSRAIVVFQNIDGVDVCIFVMFVQEFGSECDNNPNQRSIYISYLDSVKYFRPDIKTASGEALRTFVYHQIMISYLDYCKRRGFTTCYIWSCPPSKGEDFIFNCHPIDQRTPKPEKLRHWYQLMLTKAKKESVVLDCTNIYDKFFVSNRKNNRVTAARLPYFDGAYWNVVAENVIKDIENNQNGGAALSAGKLKKALSVRALKDMKCSDNPSASDIKDVLFMHKLGDFILPNKDDYIVAHLQYVCANCDEVILSSTRWSATPSNSDLCERCYCSNKIYAKGRQKKQSYTKFVDEGPKKIEDDGTKIENSIYEDRISFLKFCQENNYQFDTLRRAKHSSMMLLHELLNS